MSEESGFGIIVTKSFVRRVDLQNKPHIRMTLLERLNDLDRPVLRSVVYHNDLEAYPSLSAGRDHRLQSLLDVRLLVIASDKDGQLDFFFCHRVTYSNSLTLPRIRCLIQKITLAIGTKRFRPRK